MTFVKRNKFWLWFVMALALSMPLFSSAAVHFTKPVAIAVAEDLTTAELDATKHLTPDGSEGVQWTSPVAPVAEELTTVEADTTKRLAPDGAGGVVWGAASTITGGGAAVVANVAGLRAFEPDGVDDPEVAILAGWTAAGDGGEGTFRWDATSITADDSCMIFDPTGGGTGRWIRVTEKKQLSVKWCSGSTNAELSTPFGLAVASAVANGFQDILIPAGSYTTT